MRCKGSAIVVMLALAGPAAAQSFPSGNAWVPLPCSGGVMVDATGDTPGASGPLDVVGVSSSPAGFHASDNQFLYLRMRVAGNPLSGTHFIANDWGYEIDTDGDRTTYELIFSVGNVGGTDQVAIYRHGAQNPNNPADPATTPAAFTYPGASHWQVTMAGTTLGGGTDYFIDLALPWNDLMSLGVMRNSSIGVWAGSSTIPNALDLDLACFSGAGGTLGGINPDATTPDPTATTGTTTGTNGTTNGGGGGHTLEGGLGCDVAGPGSVGGALLLVIIAALVVARRRRLD